MKKIQHLVSILLTACMILGLFTGVSLSAFAEENVVSLSFFNADLEALSGAPGDAVTLPAAEVIADGYSFLGWTDAPVTQTEAEPVYYSVGSNFTLPEADKTLYPLFSFVDGRGTPTIDRYEKITSMEELKEGSYLIGVELVGNQLLVFDGSSANPNSSGNYKILPLASSDTVAADAASDACAVSLTKLSDSDKYSFKMNNGTGKYIGSTGSTGMASRGTKPYPVCIDFDGSGALVYFPGDKVLYLGYYQTSSTQKFGFYNNTSTTLADLCLRIDGIDGTLYYTGEQTYCAHEGTEGVVTEATCTEDGFTTYLCRTCGYKWVADRVAATGHDYVAQEIVPPTDFEDGYTVYVCSHCGDSYQDDVVEATGVFDVTFSVLGDETTRQVSVAQGIDLWGNDVVPAVIPDGYEFAGWSYLKYEATDDHPENEYDAAAFEKGEDDSGIFHPAYNTTLYAVYKRGEYEAGSGDFVKITQMPADGLDGQFLVVYEGGSIAFNGAFATTASNLAKPGNYLPVTISNHTIAATTELNAASVLIGEVGTKGTYYMQINSGLKIGSTGSSTANGINGDAKKTYQNNISFNANGTAVIANAAATNTGSNIYNFTYNDSSVDRFAFCKPTTKTVHEVCLYQKQEGTTTYFYTTAPATAGCEHEDYNETEVAPTCTQAGYTTYTCTNCGYKWTEEGDPALGHSYDEGVVTEPTPEQVGYTTYTCTVCGDKLIPEEEKVGFNFEITYNVLGTDRDPVIVNNNDGAEYPTDAPEIEGYKFIGWAEDEIIEEADQATVLTGRYIPTEDATLYAVYTRKEANTGDGNYYKVTSLPLVANGNYLIVDETTGYAFKAYEEDNEDYDLTKAKNYISVSISGNMIEESELADLSSIVINPIDGTQNYSMTGSETGKYIGTTGSSTGIMENTKNPYPVTITFSDGNAVICNVNGTTIYQLRYNTQSSSDKFGFFALTSKTADDVALYCKDGSGFTTYYTTRPTVNCAHDDQTEFEAVAPTCTANGYTAGIFCNDCETWISGHETIEKLPHSYVEDESTDATCGQDGFITWICEGCGDSYEETVPATGSHTYGENGVCTECGDQLIKIESAALRLDEDIDVIYTAKVPEGAAASMRFTMNGASVTVVDDGTHTFAFAGVNPQCMGDNIEATLTVTVGDKTYTVTKAEYSVREYCVNQLAKTDDAKFIKLLSDTLAYGACAQAYMNYKPDALVNGDVEDASYSTYTGLSGLSASFEGEAAEDIFWIGAGVTLTNSVAMTFRFYAESIEDLSVTVRINGREETFTEFAEVEGKENVYELTFAGIKATEFGDSVSASFSAGGNTVSYSVNAYICSKQADSSAALANLVKALYNYGAAAAAYAE